MLVALDDKNKLISTLENIPSDRQFYCPVCRSSVRLKSGKIMRPHFAHISLQSCHWFHEKESREHLELKAELFKSLSRKSDVSIEYFIPELNQIADLMVDEKLAIEVQCSSLSYERLKERTQAYQKYDYHVVWLLGQKLWLKKCMTSLQKQFLYYSKNMGFYLWELDLENRLVRLKYLIYEDLKGSCYYLEETCFFEDNILDFLKRPYQKQKVSSYRVQMDMRIQLYIQRQLMTRNPKWLKKQEQAYLLGENLLAKPFEDFYPQFYPIQSEIGFCQIQEDLSFFYLAFENYYKAQTNKFYQTLYPPVIYRKWSENNLKL